jgi:uncharacterized delta-60 repeat protein
MRNSIFLHLKRSVIFFAALFFIQQNISAQTPASPDTSFLLGTFNNKIRNIQVQSDGKILVAGDFTYHKSKSVNSLARLNVDGTLDTSFHTGSGPNQILHSIGLQSDGKIYIGGYFNAYNGVTIHRFARLNTDGSLDTNFKTGNGVRYPGYAPTVYSILQQSDGKILIAGLFSLYNDTSRNCLARINQDGSLDTNFNPGSGTNDYIRSMVLQPDGKIVIAGNFTSYNGTVVNRMARINPDGSIDSSFSVGTGANAVVNSIAMQNDGKIIAGGMFFTFNGVSTCLVRLKGDGSVDSSFTGTGNRPIHSIGIQADQKIIIGGYFSTFNGVATNCLVRLNPDGSADNSFNIGSGILNYTFGKSNVVYTMYIKSDGKIFIGGDFTNVNGSFINFIVHLNSDGSTDTSFNSGAGANDDVHAIVVQPDGKILVGGNFTTINSVPLNRLARLNSDGSVDTTFMIGTGANNEINAITLQADGKILIGGLFTSFNGTSLNRLARLNGNGTLDNTFNIGSGASVSVNAIAIQADGKIVIAGGFTTFNGATKSRITRLNQNGSTDNTFYVGSGPNSSVTSIAIQGDGKIILCGYFYKFRGNDVGHLIRLNPDGSVDNTFNIGWGANDDVLTIALQVDGKILIGGSFNFFYGAQISRIARLNPDGTLDSFVSSSYVNDWDVKTISIQDDGKIVLGGLFSSIGGAFQNRIIRLNPDGAVDTTFNSGIGPGTSLSTVIYTTAIQKDGKILIGGSFYAFQNMSFFHLARLNGDTIRKVNYNTIRGKIYYDNNEDCNFQGNEASLSNFVVKALPGPIYIGSDTAGMFMIKVDSGSVTYTISQEAVNPYLNICTLSHTITLAGSGKDTCCFNFANLILPEAPANVTGLKFSSTQINISWADNSNNELGFIIQRAVGSSTNTYADIDTVSLNTISFSDTALLPGIYFYKIVAYNSAGNSSSSATSGITLTSPVPAVLPNNLSRNIQIYPNPSEGIFTVELSGFVGFMEMRVYSLSGVLYKAIPLNQTSVQQVNLEEISPGAYICEIWQNAEQKSVLILMKK